MIWTDENGCRRATTAPERGVFQQRVVPFRPQGILRFVMLRPGHPTVYSFHLNDALQFQRTFESGRADGLCPGKGDPGKAPLWTARRIGMPPRRSPPVGLNFFAGHNTSYEMFAFLLSTVAISLSGVMAPGPITAATLAAGARGRHAGAMICLGHVVVELPLILLLAFASQLS